VWPTEVAPFAANLVLVGRTPEARAKAEALYERLVADGVDVLFDDRDGVSAGERFADAELLGMPMMIVVGDKGLEEEAFEVKDRATGEASRLTYGELFSKISRT
jgi:prolyl-tRNA synthetase